MTMTRRSVGIGAIILILVAIGAVMGLTVNGVCIGDNILHSLGMKAWTNGTTGTHLSACYSFIFFIPAFILWKKNRSCFGKYAGTVIAIVVGALIVFSFII